MCLGSGATPGRRTRLLDRRSLRLARSPVTFGELLTDECRQACLLSELRRQLVGGRLDLSHAPILWPPRRQSMRRGRFVQERRFHVTAWLRPRGTDLTEPLSCPWRGRASPRLPCKRRGRAPRPRFSCCPFPSLHGHHRSTAQQGHDT